MNTASCPHCHQHIEPQVVNCPYCGIPLKAYGHPGIPLHRTVTAASLCESCTYHADDSCNFPQRPHARECTLYEDISQTLNYRHNSSKSSLSIKNWLKRNQIWILLIGLLLLSLLIAL